MKSPREDWRISEMEKRMEGQLLYITIAAARSKALFRTDTTLAVTRLVRRMGYRELFEAHEISWPTESNTEYERTYCFGK